MIIYTYPEMSKKTCCSICLSVTKRTINIYGTHLPNVYEKLAEFKLPKTLVHLMTQNIENETVQDHVVLVKQEPLEFEDVQDRHIEHDDVSIKAELESNEYIDKIEIIENSIDYGVKEGETTNQYKNEINGTLQDPRVVDSIYTQQKQKVPRVVIVRLTQSDMNKYVHQRPRTHLVIEDSKDCGVQTRGKGIRDYIHVMDLASGHVAALKVLGDAHGRLKVYNLGTGRGVSVKELVDVFQRVTNTNIPIKYVERRLGDITAMWADATLAKEELGWTAQHTIEEMCTDFWRWQTMNPDGYAKKQKTTFIVVNGKS